MDASAVSALAALAGTAVGGLTSVLSNWLSHRVQAHAQWLQHEKNLYAKLSRMRVLSEPVADHAEDVTRKILDAYLELDKSFAELREMANNGTIDLLREFGTVCRQEFEDIQVRQL